MKSLHFAIPFLLTVAFMIGCGSGPVQVVQPPDTRDDDQTAIEASSKEWSDAERAKDLPKCVSFYAEDAELLRPGSSLVTGKEDLRREWEKILAIPGSSGWTPAKIEVARYGDFAYESGIYEWKGLDTKKQPMVTRGKYVRVWKKQDDGKWKVIEDIDNRDN